MSRRAVSTGSLKRTTVWTVAKRKGKGLTIISRRRPPSEVIFCIASSVHCEGPVDTPPFATATILIVDVTSGLVQFFIAEFVEWLCLISRMTSCFLFFFLLFRFPAHDTLVSATVSACWWKAIRHRGVQRPCQNNRLRSPDEFSISILPYSSPPCRIFA